MYSETPLLYPPLPHFYTPFRRPGKIEVCPLRTQNKGHFIFVRNKSNKAIFVSILSSEKGADEGTFRYEGTQSCIYLQQVVY